LSELSESPEGEPIKIVEIVAFSYPVYSTFKKSANGVKYDFRSWKFSLICIHSISDFSLILRLPLLVQMESWSDRLGWEIYFWSFLCLAVSGEGDKNGDALKSN